MKRLCAIAAAVAAALTFGQAAQAAGHLADVTLIDRASGETLTAYYHAGEYWVAGRPGARYAIRVHNNLGQRLMAVASVDGVNIITGQTAAYAQTGYVFSGWQTYQIAGWRKSDEEVADFVFTSIPDSYAARTGRPGNVGVVGVALFRERQVEPVQMQASPPVADEKMDAARANSAQAPEARRERAADKAVAGGSLSADAAAPPKPSLGTGHGEREQSVVERTEFERASEQPAEIIRIRYDSYRNLVALGVIPRPRPPRHVPDAFPDQPLAGYVPDP